uniref:Uncharacterized protein n=1 Tax=Zea mays TaxID=4577 RepID=C4J5C5_MAIZE|nr:unknown [Zea mays]
MWWSAHHPLFSLAVFVSMVCPYFHLTIGRRATGVRAKLAFFSTARPAAVSDPMGTAPLACLGVATAAAAFLAATATAPRAGKEALCERTPGFFTLGPAAAAAAEVPAGTLPFCSLAFVAPDPPFLAGAAASSAAATAIAIAGAEAARSSRSPPAAAAVGSPSPSGAALTRT